ncbi:hypothetical protein GGP41_000053 [Bipolaris sorokiniana]|uniref:Uncharacterized protein n=2 Tax=Cochliobolus sativus TaxID=45130 RepID=A0A8H6DTE8_COCSA|nr:uncharacterized protein COCSADRAFT_22045 [Bipolaris sorokiniana ND90Pr]EMD69881.1 hypothetical protein COCSADRAFT_22045 [Bipolaris sorokiniana ND90Pr]KAF5847334.1 hypothetical protein GGP41_000053 [Bipolaris sorokiniana]
MNTCIISANDSTSFNGGSAVHTLSPTVNHLSPSGRPDFIDGAPLDETLKEHDTHKSSVRLVQFHLFILRCQVLQSVLDILERKPRMNEVKSEIHTHYRKIYRFASKAGKLAEGFDNTTLQARSEYWAGRGCGGLGDWQSAKTHFGNAIKLDTPNNANNHKNFQHRGLRPNEQADVRFLLQIATQRYDRWAHKIERARKTLGELEFEEIDWEKENVEGRHWTPYRDCMKRAAKQQAEMSRKTGRPMNHLFTSEGQPADFLSQEEIKMVLKRLAKRDNMALLYRTLNAEEWRYIFRGDAAMGKDNIGTNDTGKGETEECVPEQIVDHSLPPSISASAQPSPEISRNLCDELEENEYQSGGETPALSSTSFTSHTYADNEGDVPSSTSLLPSGGLQDRRNITIAPIHTDFRKKESALSNATLKSDLDSEATSVLADDNCSVEDGLVELRSP